MNSPQPKPSLPTWLFVVTDLALIGAAAVIMLRSAHPLSASAMLAIVGCVGLGAIAGLVPLVVRFERMKNEALDDRQRALEALARTVSASAEQISIATGSLHEIAEVSQKNLRHAEHLPHKLQEKIAEFQAQLAAANDAEKEELERELVALRTSETERLETISTKIGKAVAEWAKLEAAAAQHLAAANEAAAKLPANAAAAITKAQAAADHALGEARIAAAKTLATAEANAITAVTAVQAAGLAALEAKLAAGEERLAKTTAASVEQAAAGLRSAFTVSAASLDEKIAQLTQLAQKLEGLAATLAALPAAPVAASETKAPTEPESVAVGGGEMIAVEPATPAPVEAPVEVAAPVAPKRSRRARRDESSATEPAPASTTEPAPAPASEPAASESAAEAAVVAPESVAAVAQPTEPAAAPTPAPEPTPVLADKIAEVAPVAPNTIEPFAHAAQAEAAVAAAEVAPPVPDAPVAEAEVEPVLPAPKRRAARKPEPVPEPSLDLDLEDSSPSTAPGQIERTLASDGATRLLATAYIGIGNRLFIRGEGAGLSWDKGVPLQFVSIGKWRWETNEASGPIRFKLFKNDDLECVALGEQILEPGHLQEMTAAF